MALEYSVADGIGSSGVDKLGITTPPVWKGGKSKRRKTRKSRRKARKTRRR
jgi:hypothetical protein